MFKLFSKLMMLMLVLAMAGPFIMKRPDGRPLMSLDSLSLPKLEIPASIRSLWQGAGASGSAQPAANGGAAGVNASIAWSEKSALPSSFIPKAGVEYPKQEGVYYRYKDANGIWQFGETPQPGTMNYVSSIDPKANIIQSLGKEQIDNALGRIPAEPPPDKAKEKDDSLLSKLPLPTTVPAAEIPNLIQQAKDVQTLVNERTKQLEQNRY